MNYMKKTECLTIEPAVDLTDDTDLRFEKHWKNIEKHLLPQFVNTIQVICLQNVYKIYFYL